MLKGSPKSAPGFDRIMGEQTVRVTTLIDYSDRIQTKISKEKGEVWGKPVMSIHKSSPSGVTRVMQQVVKTYGKCYQPGKLFRESVPKFYTGN